MKWRIKKTVLGVAIAALLLSVAIPVKVAGEALQSTNNGNLVKPKKQKYSHYQEPTVGKVQNWSYGKKLHTRARAYIVLNRKKGTILLQKNSQKHYLTASTSKLMTIYLARRKLANQPQGWNQKIKFSHSLVRMGANPEFDGLHVQSKRTYTVKQVLTSAIIDSDDNSAIRLGQWVAGSNKKFIKMMNKQAKLWHLKASFTSASGLENDDLAPYGYYVKGARTSGNLLSAKDLAIIAYHIAHDYPSLMKYFRTKSTYVAGQKMVNQNRILPKRKFYVKALKPDGMKTGWTPRSGYCFVGSCRKGQGLITVVLNDPDEFSDTIKLMKFASRQ